MCEYRKAKIATYMGSYFFSANPGTVLFLAGIFSGGRVLPPAVIKLPLPLHSELLSWSSRTSPHVILNEVKDPYLQSLIKS